MTGGELLGMLGLAAVAWGALVLNWYHDRPAPAEPIDPARAAEGWQESDFHVGGYYYE